MEGGSWKPAAETRKGAGFLPYTVVDLRDGTPKYCFMFIGAGGFYGAQHFVPLSALQYMEQYYGDKVLEEPDSYWNRDEKNKKEFLSRQKEMKKIAAKLEKYPVLDLQDVGAIFPDMFADESEAI